MVQADGLYKLIITEFIKGNAFGRFLFATESYMRYTHVLWDFNGTILDDIDICIESVNTLLLRRNLPAVESGEHYRSVFRFPIIKYYEKLGFDFSAEPFSELAEEWVNEYMARVERAKPMDGSVKMLEKIHQSRLGQVLVSATERDMLVKQIDMLGIAHLFDSVHGLDNIHAVNKTLIARAWREKNMQAKVLFVGDTDHDFETASAIGADCVLFCRGHQSKSALEKLGCPLIESFCELDKIIFA